MKQRSIFSWFTDLLVLKNIPEELKDENPYQYSQLFNIQMGMIILIVILILYAFSYIFFDNLQISLISVFTFAGTLFCYLYYRRDPVGRKSLISNILLSILFLSITFVVLNTGGLHSSSLVWFAILPSYMVLVNGFRNALIWLSISLGSFILLFLFDPFITNLPQYKSSTAVEFFIDYIVMTLFSLLIISTVDSSKKATLNKLNETQNKLRVLATTDSLTGLYNRRFFVERAEAEINRSIRYNTPLAVIMADLDNFKKVNDSLGHVAGDQVLIRIAEIIKDTLRDTDISGRYGGEEFIILLPATDQKESLNVAERIRSTIENTSITTNDASVKTTISIGIADFIPGDKDNLDTLTHCADMALYKSKQNGKNMVSVCDCQD